MDAFVSFCKENFQLVCLLVGFLGVLVSIVSVAYEIKKRKRRKDQNKKEDK